MRRGAFGLVLLAAWSLPAEAALWQSEQTALTASAENATLGVSGRSASVDLLGRLHLVYQRNLEGETFQVLYTVRETNGTWTPPIVLSDPLHGGRNATVATDRDGRVHVVWEDLGSPEGDIGHRVRALDGTWSPLEIVAPAPGFSRHPVEAVDVTNRLHLVWVDGRSIPQRILHAVRTPDGVWSPAEILSREAVIPQAPSMGADETGGVHVAWTDRGVEEPRRSSWSILYVRLGLEPATLAPVRIVDHSGSAVSPFVEALDDGTVHLVWLDNRTSARSDFFEIYTKRYLAGVGWGKDKRFTYDTSDHGQPVLVDSGNGALNVIWEDYRFGSPDLFYRQITPERGWDRDPTRLTADLSSSQAPSLAAFPDGRLFLFWTDSQGTGIFRVFLKEGNARIVP